MLYRVFPWLREASAQDSGGALFVPRSAQGAARHDNPEHYGALYASRSRVSAVAEAIQAFRGRTLSAADFSTPAGAVLALASIDDGGLTLLVDLDDPRQLVRRDLRPSQVATRDRSVTQRVALRTFLEGASGIGWWSTLEASWANVTLFAERTEDALRLSEAPVPLHPAHPDVIAAADRLGVRLT